MFRQISANQWYCVAAVFDHDATDASQARRLSISVYLQRPDEDRPRRYAMRTAAFYTGARPGRAGHPTPRSPLMGNLRDSPHTLRAAACYTGARPT